MKNINPFVGKRKIIGDKGDSSLISMVLIIGLTILMGAMIFSFGNFEVNKQIVEFSKLKESSQILNLKIAEVKVENLERVSLLLENNGKINIDDVMIRVNGDLGSTTIVADGIEPYTSKIVTEQIEFEKIGTIKSIDAIPISLENNQIYSISKDTTIKIEQEITDEACNADTDRDNIPDCADNCLGGKCKPKEPCKLINASWSSSKVYSGMPVSIIINGTNCLDELVDIEIYEADTFTFDDLLDPVIFDIPTNVNIENEVGIRELKLPFVEDLDGNDNIPEYRFIAKIENERIISNEVEVLNSDEIGIKPLIIPTKTNFNSFEDATFEYVFIDDEVFENLINKGDNIQKSMKNKWKSQYDDVEIIIYDPLGIPIIKDVDITKLREGKFSIKINDDRQIRPGLYKIKIILNKNGLVFENEREFSWGLIALNTDKSIYLENEISFIGMAVLDKEGNVICDADIKLEITDPDNITTLIQGSDIIISDQCKVMGITTEPDYFTKYEVNGEGEYKINMSSIINNTYVSINDSFYVVSNIDFDVQRNGPTRIFPTVMQTMNLTIKANTRYNGLIKEYVPLDFNVSVADAIITEENNTKVILWNVNLEKGQTINLGYHFDSPDISPYLYLLGKLRIDGFEERRFWQIAVDAILKNRVDMITPSSTVICNPGQQFAMSCMFRYVSGSAPEIELRWQYSIDNGQTWSLIPVLLDGLHMLWGFNTVQNALPYVVYSKDVVCSTPAQYRVRCEAFIGNWMQIYDSKDQIVRVRGVDVTLSPVLVNGIRWSVTQPTLQLGSIGNNGLGNTDYYVDINTLFTNADLYVRASGPLAFGVFTIPLQNEKYDFDWANQNVPLPGPCVGGSLCPLTQNYVNVMSNIPTGRRIYFKFYLDVPNLGQNIPPGDYVNFVDFRVVPTGSPLP